VQGLDRYCRQSIFNTVEPVVDQGSFAARCRAQVYRSQSAITQRIQRLEASIGRPLFRKVGRDKRLTEDGVRFWTMVVEFCPFTTKLALCLLEQGSQAKFGSALPTTPSRLFSRCCCVAFQSCFQKVRVVIHIVRSAFLMRLLK
jgi:hypothetical protein